MYIYTYTYIYIYKYIYIYIYIHFIIITSVLLVQKAQEIERRTVLFAFAWASTTAIL